MKKSSSKSVKQPPSERWHEIKSVASGPTILLGLTASMGGFLFGADTGQISGFLIMTDFLRRFAQFRGGDTYSFSNVREGLIVGLLSIGCLFGAVLAAPFSDKIGRRKTMILAVAVFYVGNTIQITSFQAWYQLGIGRFICGLAVGCLSVVVPVYQSETAPRQIRGALVATYQLFVTMGILTSYCINLGTSQVQDQSGSWRGAIAIMYLWSGLLALGMFFMPESPRWLLSKGRKDDAIAALHRIAGKKNRNNRSFIEGEYQEIELRVRQNKALGKAHFWDAFNPKGKVLYRTLLGFTLQMFQQLTGANYFFYYGASIFQPVGIQNSYVTQIILGGVNVVCTFPGLWFIERYGRRNPLIYGGLWQCAWLIVFASVGGQLSITDHGTGVALIVSACMFIAGFASTWGPGVWVAIGEMFPLHARSYSASFATAGNWSWNFLLTFFTPFITSAIQFRYGYVFAGCNLMAVVIVWFFYYESSGLNLEQVDAMYTDPTVKPWQSGSWVPKGHKSRYDAAEAAKEEQIAGLGSRAAAENVENVNGNDVTRDSADTQVAGEKEEERGPLPQFNRNNFARGKEEDQIPQTNRGKFSV